MNSFLTSVANATNKTLTENGAVTNVSTFDKVLDFFYHAAARRGQNNSDLFYAALVQDKLLALKTLFYLRDIRGGQGERETFRQGLAVLYTKDKVTFYAACSLVPFYGRWDDILGYTEEPAIVHMVKTQLEEDIRKAASNESISLLAKWMPSENTSSKETVALAKRWISALDMTEKQYRKMLSGLRSYLQIVEQKMSANDWDKIEYSKVPSRANLIYRKAFGKHDPVRYGEFINKAVKGEVKINSSVLYPSDIVAKYGLSGGCGSSLVDESLEALWNQLPNYVSTKENALVVADVSGSMSGIPMTVSLALAIYIAERNTGAFKDYFLTFSSKPQLNKLVGSNLCEKLSMLSQAHWEMSTDLQAVFNLILESAIANSVPENEMPSSIFIVSDMEFNVATRSGSTNFDEIQSKYNASGYKMPKLIFWNVASRNTQTPVTMDERGVYLVSGYSPSIFQKAINAQATTPYEMMLEVINGERYKLVEETLTNALTSVAYNA